MAIIETMIDLPEVGKSTVTDTTVTVNKNLNHFELLSVHIIKIKPFSVCEAIKYTFNIMKLSLLQS